MSCSSNYLALLDSDGVYGLDKGFKISSYLTETLLDPGFGHAYKSNKVVFNKAYSFAEDIWTW
jgi:hypothetical protein